MRICCQPVKESQTFVLMEQNRAAIGALANRARIINNGHIVHCVAHS